MPFPRNLPPLRCSSRAKSRSKPNQSPAVILACCKLDCFFRPFVRSRFDLADRLPWRCDPSFGWNSSGDDGRSMHKHDQDTRRALSCYYSPSAWCKPSHHSHQGNPSLHPRCAKREPAHRCHRGIERTLSGPRDSNKLPCWARRSRRSSHSSHHLCSPGFRLDIQKYSPRRVSFPVASCVWTKTGAVLALIVFGDPLPPFEPLPKPSDRAGDISGSTSSHLSRSHAFVVVGCGLDCCSSPVRLSL